MEEMHGLTPGVAHSAQATQRPSPRVRVRSLVGVVAGVVVNDVSFVRGSECARPVEVAS